MKKQSQKNWTEKQGEKEKKNERQKKKTLKE